MPTRSLFGVGEWNALSDADHRAQADAYRRVLTSTEPIGALPALSAWETWRPGRAEGPPARRDAAPLHPDPGDALGA